MYIPKTKKYVKKIFMKNSCHLFDDNRTENLFQVLNKCSKADIGKAVIHAYNKHS